MYKKISCLIFKRQKCTCTNMQKHMHILLYLYIFYFCFFSSSVFVFTNSRETEQRLTLAKRSLCSQFELLTVSVGCMLLSSWCSAGLSERVLKTATGTMLMRRNKMGKSGRKDQNNRLKDAKMLLWAAETVCRYGPLPHQKLKLNFTVWSKPKSIFRWPSWCHSGINVACFGNSLNSWTYLFIKCSYFTGLQ